MRWCPRCGRPKEEHRKVGRSTSLPKEPTPQTRECDLLLKDFVGPEDEIPVYGPDDEEYEIRREDRWEETASVAG